MRRMFKQTVFAAFAFLLVNCSPKVQTLKSHFDAAVIPPAPDYKLSKNWAALPEKKDAADSIPVNSNLKNEQGSARADLFFIHPTIFIGKPKNQFQWNADVNDTALNAITQTSTILNQATIFNGSCRVYAPYYRQAHLFAFYTEDKEDAVHALDLAYEDVKAAFKFYLENHNQGRPIVIASHSQGSYHAIRLLKEFFDGKELQKQLVSAYLVGRAIPRNTFETIPPCSGPEETGVWASWNTFARGFLPDTYARYYTQALSTNPLLWNSTEDFASRDLNKGGVALNFTMVPQLADAQNHQNLLWINKPYVKGRFLLKTKIWHRADMNFYYMSIRENVALRVEKFLEGSETTR